MFLVPGDKKLSVRLILRNNEYTKEIAQIEIEYYTAGHNHFSSMYTNSCVRINAHKNLYTHNRKIYIYISHFWITNLRV